MYTQSGSKVKQIKQIPPSPKLLISFKFSFTSKGDSWHSFWFSFAFWGSSYPFVWFWAAIKVYFPTTALTSLFYWLIVTLS
jgi:hypothetical protein